MTLLQSPLDKKTPMRRYNLRVKFENCDKGNGLKRLQETDESEGSEESPPKVARETCAPGKGDMWSSPPLNFPQGASTPHPMGVFTPSPLTPMPDDMSPITRSAQRMPKAMQVRITYAGCLGGGAGFAALLSLWLISSHRDLVVALVYYVVRM